MRVLIVEDEIKIRIGISKLISSQTAHIVVGEAKNGKEGLELIQRFHPELVISDIRMPVMDGLEMVQKAMEAGSRSHFVILSGYSEFEYAQRAIRYGVDDYLLKPLAPEDVIGLLDKIQGKIEKEEAQSAQSTEGLIRDILLGTSRSAEDSFGKLETTGALNLKKPLCILAGYLGNTSDRYRQAIFEQLQKMKKDWKEFHIYGVALENTQELLVIIQGDDYEEIENKLSRRIYQNLTESEQPVWVYGEQMLPGELSEVYRQLRECYLYGISLGYREIINRDRIKNRQEEEFQYPLFFESQLRNAICREAPEHLKKEAEKFISHASSMQCNPRYIKKTYKKILLFLENVCHEVNPEAYRLLQSQDLEKYISSIYTRGELEGCFTKVIDTIAESKDKKEDIRNYAIRRAINYIREHFAENISLDMLAESLEITPEYLSTLFNKEVGINFSTFLKRFRISQAKRLLKGTDEKIYAIAVQVGYNDPKYFNRVFKEEVGVSPGEYRQNN